MSELKQCPFCGGEAELRFFNNGPSFSYRVECLNCTAMVGRRFEEYSTNRTFWFGIKQEAIDAWNTRAERTCEMIPNGETDFAATLKCSVCGNVESVYAISADEFNYCPNCGARVTGGARIEEESDDTI